MKKIKEERKINIKIDLCHKEGDWVGASEPLMYITGSFYHLVDLETELLQKIGATCVAAYNAYSIIELLPNIKFLAMDARHCAGRDMQQMMAYSASVATKYFKTKNKNVHGFIGNANDSTAHFFNNKHGFGTMPHALIGYAGSTLKAAQMYHETYKEENLTVLIDYFAREVDDALEVCKNFPELIKQNKLALRLDTHGGRYMQGLDLQKSYDVLNRNIPNGLKRYRTEEELKYLVGTGVSIASIFKLREELDMHGFNNVKIVASSGFNFKKCKLIAELNAPVDIIGTGSFYQVHGQKPMQLPILLNMAILNK